MTDIRQWLAALDLGKYADIFAENDIDLEAVRLLGEADLEKLGVSLGHRKRILKAATTLAGNAQSATPPDRAPAVEAIAPGADRRQLTVLFCDLAGSTEMSVRLDPEDMREIISNYQRLCTNTIQRFDGYVAKYTGDGVLAYFGYPHASEDAADRAVSAGLEIVQAIKNAGTEASGSLGQPLSVRIGIATGEVVVGDQIGADSARESAVIGETPNLAARLQTAADPGQVIVGDRTRHLTRREFSWLGPQTLELKGFRAPVRAWQALPQQHDARIRSTAPDRPRMVGRQSELALLHDRLDLSKAAEGQVVVLVGDAGIGKTTMTKAVLDRADREGLRCIQFGFSPFHQNSELWPFAALVERRAGIIRGDPPQENLQRLEAWLREFNAERLNDVALFAALLALPVPANELSDIQPRALREKTLGAIEANILDQKRMKPTLLIFEDVHWMDPTSAELLGRLVEHVSARPLLIFATARPGFEAAWTRLAHVTFLTLSRMPNRDATALIMQVAGTRELPGNVVEQLLARAQGNPLYVEELTKSVIEAMADSVEARPDADPAKASPIIPTSLRDSLMERLDRLGPAKELAQAASVIGQEFDERLLQAIVDQKPGQWQVDLDRLIKSQILIRKVGDTTAYTFRHALIQETAYQSLLKARRRDYHRRIAEAMERGVVPELRDREPERIAQHFTEAGLFDRAIGCWQSAGLRASQRSASREAVQHFETALDLVRRHVPEAERAAKEMPLLTSLGPALMATRGWNVPEVRKVYDDALRLAAQTGRSAEMFPAAWGRWLTAHAGGEAQIARDLMQQMFDLIGDRDDPDLMMQAHHAGCSTECLDGNLSGTIDHMNAAMAIYDLQKHRHQAMRYGGHDPCVCMQCTGALAEMMRGHAARSSELSDQARELADNVEHVPTIAHARWYGAELNQILGRPGQARELADQVLTVALDKGLSQYAAWAKMVRGWVLTAQGSFTEGLREMEEGLGALKTVGVAYHLNHRLGMRAQAFALADDQRKAMDAIEEAIDAAGRTGERWYEAELLRIKAEILASDAIADVRAAETCLEASVATASGQGAALWEARARIDLATLLAKQQREAVAGSVIEPMRAWGPNIDLPERGRAQTLLERLNGR